LLRRLLFALVLTSGLNVAVQLLLTIGLSIFHLMFLALTWMPQFSRVNRFLELIDEFFLITISVVCLNFVPGLLPYL